MFLPVPGGGGGDRPAAAPMLARGLFALHARYGRRPFESLVSPAEQLARFGAPVSRAFARDLAVVAGPLAGDPEAAGIFLPSGRAPAEGDMLMQQQEIAYLQKKYELELSFKQQDQQLKVEVASAQAAINQRSALVTAEIKHENMERQNGKAARSEKD